jgi:hypothetical protein
LRILSSIQTTGICGVPQYSEKDFNIAVATSSFVVLIFSVVGTHTIDGYAIVQSAIGEAQVTDFTGTGYAPGLNPRPTKVRFIRRGVIPFDQISHIRDNVGLQGRPVASAKDGMLLGSAAGRAICRLIDKRAFKDDPIHYSDAKYVPRLLPDTQPVSVLRVKRDEAAFLGMTYDQYRQWYEQNEDKAAPAPTLSNLVDKN